MINEDKIREACASDKEHGFKLLMENFQQPIYWHIRRLVVSHEDAEDILQEVFIRVFRHLDRFREESSLGTWMSPFLEQPKRAGCFCRGSARGINE